MLAELAEIGLRLSRAVADHAERELDRAADGQRGRLPPEPADGSPREARTCEPRETLADDNGRLLDDNEWLIEKPAAMLDTITDRLCQSFGLAPHRLAWRGGAWTVKAHPTDPAARADPDAATPFRDWRPDFPVAAFDWFTQRPTGPTDPIIDTLCDTFRVDRPRLSFRNGEWKVRMDPDLPDAPAYMPLRSWPRILPGVFEPPPDPEPEPGPPAQGPPVR